MGIKLNHLISYNALLMISLSLGFSAEAAAQIGGGGVTSQGSGNQTDPVEPTCSASTGNCNGPTLSQWDPNYGRNKYEEIKEAVENGTFFLCEAILGPGFPEGGQQGFMARDGNYKWKGSLLKLNGKCTLEWVEVDYNKAIIDIAKPDEAGEVCGTCKIKRGSRTVFSFSIWYEQGEVTLPTDGNPDRSTYRILVPRVSNIWEVTQLPQVAAGCCEGRKACKVIPELGHHRQEHFSWLAHYRLIQDYAEFLAGGLLTVDQASISAPLREYRDQLRIPGAYLDPAKDFCDPGYTKTFNPSSTVFTFSKVLDAWKREGAEVVPYAAEYCDYLGGDGSDEYYTAQWMKLPATPAKSTKTTVDADIE
jgi:hypothetical protein